jgi:hypothetical protein
LLVEFEMLGEEEETCICAFFNMGNGAHPKVGRLSRYFSAWTIANGEQPRKGQQMLPDVFLEGQVYEVEVEDCRKGVDEEMKSEAEIYSVVTRIISATHPQSSNPNLSIGNQESLNHAIKQSTNQVGQYSAGRKSARK